MLALNKIIPLICLLIIELEAQFFNDQNSQVGTQISTSDSNFFNNEQGAQVGAQYGSESSFNNGCVLVPDSGTCSTNQCGLNGESYNWCWTINGDHKWANCNCAQVVDSNQGSNGNNGNQNNVNTQAVFHNDANTQVGQQVGSPDYFNNHPETQVGNTNQGYQGNNGNPNIGNNQAMFHNDANTQVGQQVGSSTYFNNHPETQVGNNNQGYQGINGNNGNFGINSNPNNANNQAIFHNDAMTQVGQQVGSSNYFNNHPETQVGNTNEGFLGNNGNNGNTGYNGNPNNGNNQAIFHNDANTQVGQQVGSSDYFNNHPETQVGNTNQGYSNNGNNAYNGNPNNANNQAIFHNDANTQVGQQFGSPNNFNNHPDAQIGAPRRRYARSPQSALCPVCKPGFLKGFNNPLLTGVNEEGATFNRNAQIDTQQVGKGGTFFNGQSQIGSQVDIGLGGLGFINKGSQVQKQVGCGNLIHNPTELQKCLGFGRKKREAQFTNLGSSVGTQVGLDGSTFLNENSQIAQAHASKGATIIGSGSQYQSQTGYGSNAQLLALLRSKREAQFHNVGSSVGTQVAFNGSSFLNENSQIAQAHASKGANIIGSGSQYQSQTGYGSDAQLSSFLFGRKKREAQFLNLNSGVGTQVGLAGSSFNNQGSQIGTSLGAKGSNFLNQASQVNVQKGFGSNADLLSGLNLPSVGGSGHIFNKQSQIGTQFGGRKKREAQFWNIGSQVGEQFGHKGSSFGNLDSQISSQFGEVGSNFQNQGSQIGSQQGLGNLGLGSIAQLPGFSAGGSGHIFNKQSQINTQIGG